MELKPGLIIFRLADVAHRNWYCRVKLPRADRHKTIADCTGSNIDCGGGLAPGVSGSISFGPAHTELNNTNQARQQTTLFARVTQAVRDHPVGSAIVAGAVIGAGFEIVITEGAALAGAAEETIAAGEEAAAAEEAALSKAAPRPTCCFVAGTLVDTAKGLLPIDTIATGDFVRSRDPTTGITALKPVTSLIHRHDREIYVLTLAVQSKSKGEHKAIFKTTDDHPWRAISGEWLHTVELKPGLLLQRAEGAPARVLSVVNSGKTAPTFNIEVADFHTYFVGKDKIWVHNACSDLVKAARDLGYKLDKGFGRMHGQDVFKKGSRYITRDVDSHSGGVWKMFDRQGNRLGTFDKDLNRIGD